jgi:hypothetical protein
VGDYADVRGGCVVTTWLLVAAEVLGLFVIFVLGYVAAAWVWLLLNDRRDGKA